MGRTPTNKDTAEQPPVVEPQDAGTLLPLVPTGRGFFVAPPLTTTQESEPVVSVQTAGAGSLVTNPMTQGLDAGGKDVFNANFFRGMGAALNLSTTTDALLLISATGTHQAVVEINGPASDWVILTNRSDPGLQNLQDLGIINSATGARIVLSPTGTIAISGLPSVAPAPGSKQLWYDPADGNRVKFMP